MELSFSCHNFLDVRNVATKIFGAKCFLNNWPIKILSIFGANISSMFGAIFPKYLAQQFPQYCAQHFLTTWRNIALKF